MPELLFRYQVPKSLTLDYQIRLFEERVQAMTTQIQAKAEEVFELDVVWEIREFGKTHGMPTFYLTGWITDNLDSKKGTVLRAQEEILGLMQALAFKGETVGCRLQRVRGKWGEAEGLLDPQLKRGEDQYL